MNRHIAGSGGRSDQEKSTPVLLPLACTSPETVVTSILLPAQSARETSPEVVRTTAKADVIPLRVISPETVLTDRSSADTPTSDTSPETDETSLSQTKPLQRDIARNTFDDYNLHILWSLDTDVALRTADGHRAERLVDFQGRTRLARLDAEILFPNIHVVHPALDLGLRTVCFDHTHRQDRLHYLDGGHPRISRIDKHFVLDRLRPDGSHHPQGAK